MKLAVSNIAWAQDEEAAVAQALAAEAVEFVEIAPTKVFHDPLSTRAQDRSRYSRFWADHGITIVAFQSMLFGRPELQLFGAADTRRELVSTLVRFVELAGQMDVGRLVFGSPKNRIVPPGMGNSEAQIIAVDVFSEIAEAAVANGTEFCIEPNPTAYECNFVTTASEGLALVEEVDHPGFGLHLDAAGMTLSGDSPSKSIENADARLRHFHASAPYLGALEDKTVAHAEAAASLASLRYDKFVSIEMRPSAEVDAAEYVVNAVTLARKHYRSHR